MPSSDPPSYPQWELLASWVAVVETGSVSEAARTLGISQAAVSQRIKQLETVTATSLLDRTTRPAQPTHAGQLLFEHAKGLLTQAAQMMESLRSVTRAKRMIVRIGCVDSFAATLGPALIKSLGGLSHQIRLWSGITPTLDAQIEARQLDLAVTTSEAPHTGISRAELFSERYYVVLPAGFAGKRSGSLTELSQTLPFIRYSARSLIGQQVESYLQKNGDALKRTCEFDATDPLLSLVSAGMGFALTTPLCIWQSRQFIDGLRILPLSAFSRPRGPYEPLQRTFYLAYRSGELGTLPQEVRDIVRISIRSSLDGQIAKSLGLPPEVLRLG